VPHNFEDLVALQQTLLSPQGCPWDREQTHDTLRTYLLEETYEVLDAIDSGDSARFSEELGDLLLQIVFHANLAQMAGRFDIGDVIESIYTKMVRRHPHVFSSDTADTPAAVLKNWEHLKAEERRQKEEAVNASRVSPEASRGAAPSASSSLLDGVPKNLPAILQAFQLTRRAARIGFDWERIEGVLDKVAEEAGELRATLGDPGRARKEEEVGDLLFAVVNVARFLDLDPELALRKANQKFAARFQKMEREAARAGQPLAGSTPQQFDLLWEQAKDKS
jgi:MazG family protein